MPPYEHTLSLNALFAPEADGRGALGAGADAVEAIFSEIRQLACSCYSRTQLKWRPEGAGNAVRSLP